MAGNGRPASDMALRMVSVSVVIEHHLINGVLFLPSPMNLHATSLSLPGCYDVSKSPVLPASKVGLEISDTNTSIHEVTALTSPSIS